MRTGKIVLVLATVPSAVLCPKSAMCERLCDRLKGALLRLVSFSISANIAPMSKAITVSVISADRLGKGLGLTGHEQDNRDDKGR
jgi:hypothetical protein